jgi:hypothetical protein
MTPEQERDLLAAAAKVLDGQALVAYQDLIELIRSGVAPRDAVSQVMQDLGDDMAATMAAALTAVSAQAVAADAVLQLQVGAVNLSGRLWQEADETGIIVQGIVQRHIAGFVDARKLALQLFEGYEFRDPAAEPLQINAANRQLPRFLREALLSDPGIERDLAVNFAKIQVNGMASPALRAAYAELLDSITALEGGKGQKLLDKRIEVAFYERLRYFAQRIAQTEIHRAFAKRQAEELMADVDVEFVQVKRAPGRGEPCICDLFTGRDVYGLGAGVYPKPKAPLPPYHPYCRCVLSARLDLTGRAKAKPADPDADSYFLNNLGVKKAARVIGSRAKLEQVLDNGRSADEVFGQGKKVPILTVAEGARI